MKNTFIWAAALLFTTACKELPVVDAVFENVVPIPEFIGVDTGETPFVVSSETLITYTEGDETLRKSAELFAGYLKDQLGFSLKVQGTTLSEKEAENCFFLQISNGTNGPESYTIQVDEHRVLVQGTSEAGIFHGLQTLRKALPIVSEECIINIPASAIVGEPRFEYRGAHLDVSRHFFPIDSVKCYIDMMALHDMNTLHWHLTDDQGWRIEIKKYPELTNKGSLRHGTMVNRDFSSNDGINYGGFYTQEEAREIVKYAAERFITVIPEIDMPGHMQAALNAYPEFGCTGGPYEVWTIWGISDDVLCAGNEKIYTFCKQVLDEIMDIFPSEYIHIGGDECPKTRWKECSKCQKLMKKLKLTDDENYTAEQKLQSYFTRQIDQYLNEHGRTAIGWDEILEGGVSDNAVIMSWRGTEGGRDAALQGHKAIMSPSDCLYLNFYQTQDTVGEPLAFDAYCPLSRIYAYDPVPSGLTPAQRKNILGVQGNLWSEYFSEFHVAQYMFLPRAAALAEIQWLQTDSKDYDAFLQRLEHMKKFYQLYGYRYCDKIE